MWMIHKEDLLLLKEVVNFQKSVGSRRIKAAVDLTIEENVLKKILQENKIMSDVIEKSRRA